MRFQLIGKKVVIDVDKVDIARSESGIYLSAETVKFKDKNIGTISQVGLECVRETLGADGTRRGFKVGDRVSILAHQGTKFEFEGEDYIIFDEDFIFAMVYDD